ncbi:MAG TPA: hypothetical protein VFS31_00455, partial [Chitinophagaceae bacterium]|nr:hypothetical protein [Chitinophagaceae bacterium]
MKKFWLAFILLCSFIASYAQSSNGINWDRYYITGSLALGKKATGQYADTSLWLEVGKDTTTKGFGMPKVFKASYATVRRGVFVYALEDSCLYQFDGAAKIRYLNIKDTVLIKNLIAQYGGGNTDSSLFVTVTRLMDSLVNYVPKTTTLTINGVAHDLSTSRSWTISASDSAQYADTAKYALNSGLLQSQNLSYVLNRTNHTGTQAISTVTGQTDSNATYRDSIDAISGRLNTLSVDSAAYADTARYALNSGQLQGQNLSYVLNRANHTGVQAISTITGQVDSNTTYRDSINAISGRLATISVDSAKYADTAKYALNSGLLQGQSLSYVLNRSNHTGTQAISTITGQADSNSTYRDSINAISNRLGTISVDSSKYSDTAKYALNSGLLQGQNLSYVLNRANHTGTQAISTIVGQTDSNATYRDSI